MMACPYKARSFVHEVHDDQVSHNPRGKGCVESCNLCVTRVDAGGVPACVEGCSHQAIEFGDLNDPAFAEKLKQDPTSQIREDLGLNPGIHYKGI
jgi:molybdopterin-containing oxidoreductase family iron-sulfur binding subunit